MCKNLANYITIVRSAAIQSRKSERKEETMKTEVLYATLDNCSANTQSTLLRKTFAVPNITQLTRSVII